MIESASFAELSPLLLYRILRLRWEVFGLEQNCLYADLDGRDPDPTTVHFWVDDDPASPTVSACARLLGEPDGSRSIGRVVTAAGRRGTGVAGSLMDAALAVVPAGTPVRLNAQRRLEGWYGRWGFRRDGADFVEDGIWHVPMTR